MNTLAQIMVYRGANVSGSDRNYDNKINIRCQNLFDKLTTSQGILLFKQDGSGLEKQAVDYLVVSSAIEDDNQEIIKARQKGIPIIHRAGLLAQIANSSKCIAVAGTSGKTTITGMIGYILYLSGKDPTIINGGIIRNFCSDTCIGNALNGKSELCVIETDESDGSIVNYNPEIGVITNIALDHKPIAELQKLFERFALQVKGTLILNQDCARSNLIKCNCKRLTFGIKNNADISAKNIDISAKGTCFEVNGIAYYMRLHGLYNVYNALAAIASTKILGLDDSEISQALAEFTGIKRRLELIGEVRGIKIFDDYAHNPDKIKASIETLNPQFSRLHIIFQPHGFGPTRLLKQELIEVFSQCLRKNDILYMPEIYYAGGTVVRNISSADLVSGIQGREKQAFYITMREEIIAKIVESVVIGDAIVVMGARDDSLSEFCLMIKEAIENTKGGKDV